MNIVNIVQYRKPCYVPVMDGITLLHTDLLWSGSLNQHTQRNTEAVSVFNIITSVGEALQATSDFTLDQAERQQSYSGEKSSLVN